MTDQPAEVSAADRAAMEQAIAASAKFINDMTQLTPSRFALAKAFLEFANTRLAAERERAQRLESCLRELLDNGAFPTAAEDRARAALEK